MDVLEIIENFKLGLATHNIGEDIMFIVDDKTFWKIMESFDTKLKTKEYEGIGKVADYSKFYISSTNGKITIFHRDRLSVKSLGEEL